MSASTVSEQSQLSSTEIGIVYKSLLPYLVAILVQLPMLLLYYKGLWTRPHYQFFPFVMAACLFLGKINWPRSGHLQLRSTLTSNILFGLAFFFFVCGVLFVDPWFNALSAMLVLTSALHKVYDIDNERSLWAVSLPIYTTLTLPFGYDTFAITRLQSISAVFSSQLLDLGGVGHFMDGVKLVLPNGSEFFIEEGCSGVVSFFTLLAITAVYIVYARRIHQYSFLAVGLLFTMGLLLNLIDWVAYGTFGYLSLAGLALILIGAFGIHAGILLFSTVFWSIFMNTLRIVMIPIAEVKLDGLNLAEGVLHHILGYIVLVAGALLVFSTDQFLSFLFGPVEVDSEDTRGMQKTISRYWNQVFSGVQRSSTQRKKLNPGRQSPAVDPLRGKAIIWSVIGVMFLLGLFQLWDVQRSWAQSDLKVRFFDSDVTVDFQLDDLPPKLESWERVDYQMEDRSRGSDLGQRSDFWIYQGPRCTANLSLDQTFPGWHELTICYKNQGWNLVSRRVHEENEDGQSGWPFVEARFRRNTGEQGYLLFSLFDSQGSPIDAPSWNKLSSFFIRLQNRLSNRIRATLFDSEAYQTQIFLVSYNDFDEELREEIKQKYLAARELKRERFIELRKGE